MWGDEWIFFNTASLRLFVHKQYRENSPCPPTQVGFCLIPRCNLHILNHFENQSLRDISLMFTTHQPYFRDVRHNVTNNTFDWVFWHCSIAMQSLTDKWEQLGFVNVILSLVVYLRHYSMAIFNPFFVNINAHHGIKS